MKRTTAKVSFLLCLISGVCGNVQADVARPNILFIFSDDQCWDALGSIGGEVKTPALDRLVDRGTFFENAYNMGAWQGAVCIASRTMLMTGKDLWKAGAYDSSTERSVSDFWSHQFKEAGYRTYFAGKWHVSKIEPADIYDVTGTVRPGMPDYHDPALGGRYPWNVRGAGYLRPEGPGEDNWDPSDPVFGGFWEGGKHWSEVLGDEGVHFIEDASKSDQPFFMQLAFNAPHDPRQSPKEYIDMYPLDTINVPENFVPENAYAEAMEAGRGLRDEDLAPFPRTEHAIKKHRQEYFAIITHMDDQIARIISALEETGQRENTIIVFTSDHGLGVGQHGLVGKQNMFEHSVKPPLIFCGKGIPKGKIVSTSVYMQDLMPTTFELAGLEIPDHVDFKSLLPVLDGSVSTQYSAIYGAYKDKQRMLLKDGKKLIWYPDVDAFLLFDINKDPKELEDLSSNPEYAGVLRTLKFELKKQQIALQDPMLVAGSEAGSVSENH